MNMYFEKIKLYIYIVYSLHYAAFGHLNIKSLHKHVQCRHVHTRSIPVPVAQSVECLLRKT